MEGSKAVINKDGSICQVKNFAKFQIHSILTSWNSERNTNLLGFVIIFSSAKLLAIYKEVKTKSEKYREEHFFERTWEHYNIVSIGKVIME